MKNPFLKLFQQTNSKPKAMAFVDYEHWFYSYRLQFGMKPNVTSWMESLQEKYDVLDVMVFAAFDQKAIHDELKELRNITNTIIETHQQNGYHKKDMTDFIMLDYINKLPLRGLKLMCLFCLQETGISTPSRNTSRRN